ncbi:hypothetical protein IFR04_013997 [Cadophora malorum]|uniref:Uncharacterized protein n=1 Tax=Cadophora malorum TaxID=108018 RepID=A0A8H7T4J3_9HELO|nr:hypothetical protein IFR04_013997 [Cadophora malorum]
MAQPADDAASQESVDLADPLIYPLPSKSAESEFHPILCPRGTPPLLSMRAPFLILIIAARGVPNCKNASRS